jgi:hypothetical protein
MVYPAGDLRLPTLVTGGWEIARLEVSTPRMSKSPARIVKTRAVLEMPTRFV